MGGFADAGDRIVQGVAAGLYEAGTIVLAQSQIIVPVEYGTLKGSGQVDDPVVEPDSVSVTVGYGGAASAYAFWVHNRVVVETYKGRPVKDPGKPVYHKPPTQAKFLSTPADAIGPELPGILEHNVHARLKG